MPPRTRLISHPYRLAVTLLLGLALTTLIGLFIWPTPYRFQRLVIGDTAFYARTRRATGVTEILRAGGWERVNSPDSACLPLTELPTDVMRTLIGSPRIEWGSLQYDLTNRTAWTIWEIDAILTVRNAAGAVMVERSYTLRNSTSSVRCDPGATANFFARLGFAMESGDTWNARVTAARGTQ